MCCEWSVLQVKVVINTGAVSRLVSEVSCVELNCSGSEWPLPHVRWGILE
jgi:hypothetical protein